MSTELLEKYNIIRNTYINNYGAPKCIEQVRKSINKMFDAFLSRYNSIPGTEAFQSKKETALEYLCNFYLQNDDIYFILHDLNTLFTSLANGKVKITIHCDHVSELIWKNNLSFISSSMKARIKRESENLALLKRKKERVIPNTPFYKLDKEKQRIYIHYECEESLKKWLHNNGYDKEYDSIHNIEKNDERIHCFLHYFVFVRKDKKLIQLFNDIRKLIETSHLTEDTFITLVETIYKKPFEKVKFEPCTRKLSPENKELYKNSRSTWNWLSNKQVDESRSIRREYKRIYFIYKNCSKYVITINGTRYRCEDIRKKILYRLTIEDIKATDFSQGLRAATAYWIDIITKRHPELVLPTK